MLKMLKLTLTFVLTLGNYDYSFNTDPAFLTPDFQVAPLQRLHLSLV